MRVSVAFEDNIPFAQLRKGKLLGTGAFAQVYEV